MRLLSALHDGFRAGPDWPASLQRGNRRRLLVFAIVFVLACASTLAYDFMRPPVYRATALLQINPGSVSVPVQGENAPPAESSDPLLTEIRVLTSRPLIQQVVEQLLSKDFKPGDLGADPVGNAQQMITATAVDKTNVVDLAAEGPQPEILSALLNTLVDTYRGQMVAAHSDSFDETLVQTREEVANLELSVTAKRREVNAFGDQNGIVSTEREENEALSRIKGLGASINLANERVVAAEARLRSLKESMASGKLAALARDNPTLANLEQRISQAQEQLRDMERGFTPAYMAMDPQARALRVRLNELQEQLKVQREDARQSMLSEVQEEASAARAAADRLRQQVVNDKRTVQQFSANFNEYSALQEELAQLEKVHRDAKERLVKLTAAESAHAAGVRVLEAATTPQEPARPYYARDAVLGIVGSILLALFAMWLVEWFNREPPLPTMLVAQHEPPHPPIPALRESRLVPVAWSEPSLLPINPLLPRELTEAEIALLLQTAGAESLIAALALLQGLSAQELIGLRWQHIDLQQRTARIPGDPERMISLPAPLCTVLKTSGAGSDSPQSPIVHDGRRQPLSLEDLDAMILCMAHDAGIERAATVTAAVLRHSYLAFLVRQGIRFSDLFRIVGRLPAETLAAYSVMSPPGIKLPAEAIERVPAPVRQLSIA